MTDYDGGEVRREITLRSPCAAAHLFRVSSGDEKLLHFEPPADKVTLGANAPQRLTVVINPAAANAGEFDTIVFNVAVLIECLDCRQDRSCLQTRRELIAKVTVNKRRQPPQTTTTPTPDPEVEKLAKEGPDFPRAFPLNDVQFRALLNNDWSLDFAYELTQPAVVTLTVLVDGLTALYLDFRMNAGRHEELIPVPNPSGRLGVATYRIKVVTDSPPAAGRDPFMLLWMAAGEPSSASARRARPGPPPAYSPPAYPSKLSGARFADAAYRLDARAAYDSLARGADALGPAPRGTNVPLGLASVTFAPREIRLPQGRTCANVTYGFRTTRIFGGGARADIRLIEGGTSTLVGGQLYEEGLEAGRTLGGSWDCMSGGSPSLGRHVLFVKAWFTVQAGGNWSFVHSPPVVVRR